jgi:branched-chain amino acid transport system substrate-binding protein
MRVLPERIGSLGRRFANGAEARQHRVIEENDMIRRTMVIVAVMLILQAAPAMAVDPVKIGVLSDMSGVFQSIDGPGSVLAAQMAIEDFGGEVLGKKIDLVSADHQNKVDIGSAIAGRWFDIDGVDLIIDIPNSSVALAVQSVGKDRKKMVIISGAGSSDLTGKSCSPTGIHWTWDSDSYARATANAVVDRGGKDWFFIIADYAFGHSIERATSAAVRTYGGSVVGSVRAPFNTSDFSSFLLQAKSSKAAIIGLGNAGSDVINSIKQAREFDVGQDGSQRLVPLSFGIVDVHALGLQQAQDLLFTDAFYWDRTEATRAWSRRFFERQKAMPTKEQAGVYSATMHYLKAVAAVQKKDALAVIAKMRETPIHDFFAENGVLRPDGLMVHDLYLLQVKKPTETKYPWDYATIAATIKGDDAFASMNASECSLIRPN